jgi:hypothetical protein
VPKGYATSQFEMVCPCGFKINHEALRVFSFFLDLKRHCDCKIPYLAGLRAPGIDAHGVTECIRRAAQRIHDGSERVTVQSVQGWAERASFTMLGARTSVLDWAAQNRAYRQLRQASLDPAKFKLMVRKDLPLALRKMGRVYSSRNGVVSLDLAAAVMRQAAFVGSMERIGWLDIDRWTKGTDETRFYLLQKAAARYRKLTLVLRLRQMRSSTS